MSIAPIEGELVHDEDFHAPAVQTQRVSTAMAIATSRQAQEIQAAMCVAKNFPRDQAKAVSRILLACQRKSLAETAIYEYPRGGQKVTGLSIRMAEVLAQNWGNIDFGIIELDRGEKESVAMSYAWDLETNVRQTKVFTVRHVRDTKKGQVELTDERDIYEMVANQGARRMRNCILAIIPRDVQDKAEAACEKALRSADGGEPLSDRIAKMLVAFAGFGVSQAMIEAKIQHSVNAISLSQLAKLIRIHNSIRDKVGEVEDFFDPEPGATPKTLDDLVAKADAKADAKKKPAKKQPPAADLSDDRDALETMFVAAFAHCKDQAEIDAKFAALLDEYPDSKELIVKLATERGQEVG